VDRPHAIDGRGEVTQHEELYISISSTSTTSASSASSSELDGRSQICILPTPPKTKLVQLYLSTMPKLESQGPGMRSKRRTVKYRNPQSPCWMLMCIPALNPPKNEKIIRRNRYCGVLPLRACRNVYSSIAHSCHCDIALPNREMLPHNNEQRKERKRP
jgi:hypothetical protein